MSDTFGKDQVRRLGRHLRALREARWWSVGRLSETSGLSIAAIRKIEAGRADPRLSSVLALAEALGEPIDRLIDKVREPEPLVHVTHPDTDADAASVGTGDLTGLLRDPAMRAQIVALAPGQRTAIPAEDDASAFCYVLDGALSVDFADGAVETLAAGDALHALKPRPLAWTASARGARCVHVTSTPGGADGAKMPARPAELLDYSSARSDRGGTKPT